MIDTRRPQALLGQETLEQALRQLVLYGPDGLPVLSDDRERLIGWITHADVLRTLAERVSRSASEAAQGTLAAAWASEDPDAQLREAPNPLEGYELIEIAITEAGERRVDEVDWPPGSIVAARIAGRRTTPLTPDAVLRSGDRVLLLVPSTDPDRKLMQA